MRAPCLQLPRGARQEILQRLLPRCGWYHGDRVQLPTSRMRSHGGRRGRSVRLLPFSRGTNRGLKRVKKLRLCRSAVRPQAANLLLGARPSCAVRLSAIRTTAPQSRPPAPSCWLSTAAFSDSLGSRSPSLPWQDLVLLGVARRGSKLPARLGPAGSGPVIFFVFRW